MRRVKRPAVFNIEPAYVLKVSGVASSPREKGFSFRAVTREAAWDWLRLEMLSEVPNLPRIVAQAISNLSIYTNAITDRLVAMCQEVKERAREKGVDLKIRAGSCHRDNCSICFGTWPLHYPWLLVWNESIRDFIKVETADLKDFLRDLGFDEEWIHRFEALERCRRVLVSARNWAMYIAYRHGLIEPPEESEGEGVRRVKRPAVFEVELTYVPKIAGTAKWLPHEKGFSFRAMMRETNWDWLRLEMLAEMPNLPRIVAQAINNLNTYVDVVTLRLIVMCQKIKEVARQKSIKLRIIAGCCGRPNCGVCFGTWNLHYPWLYVRDKKVKTADLKNFLWDLGFDEEWIDRFISLIRARRVIVNARNWIMYIAYCHGLIDLPEGEELLSERKNAKA